MQSEVFMMTDKIYTIDEICEKVQPIAEKYRLIRVSWYPNIDSLTPGGISSLSPTYPVHVIQKFNIKLQ